MTSANFTLLQGGVWQFASTAIGLCEWLHVLDKRVNCFYLGKEEDIWRQGGYEIKKKQTGGKD